MATSSSHREMTSKIRQGLYCRLYVIFSGGQRTYRHTLPCSLSCQVAACSPLSQQPSSYPCTHPSSRLLEIPTQMQVFSWSLFFPLLYSILECHALISGTVFTQLMTRDLSFWCTLSITPQYGLEAVQNPSCLAWPACCLAVCSAVGRL